MPGHPRLTVTLSVRASRLALKKSAANGDEPGNYVDDLVILDNDEAVGYFDGVAEEFERDLEAVADEMAVPS